MSLAGLSVLPYEAPYDGVTGYRDKLGIRMHGDIRIGTRRIGRRLGAGEIILAHKHSHMRGIAGEEDGFLCRRKTAARDEDRTSREELAVADCAVGNAVAAELLLARKAGTARACTGCQKHREARELSPAGLHVLHVAREVDLLHLGEQHLGTEGLGLLAHRVGELCARGRKDTWIVHDLRRDRDLAPEMLALDHKDAVAGTCQIERRREAGWTAADNHRIIDLLFLFHGRPPS